MFYVSTEQPEVSALKDTSHSSHNSIQMGKKGPYSLGVWAPKHPKVLCPYGEERSHDGGSIVLAQTARAPVRLQPYGSALAAELLRSIFYLGITRDSWASNLGIGKHSLEPWHAGANCQNL